MNIFATLANHPDLMRRWLVFGNHVLFKSTLPPREREIAILRIGWLCQAEYEWAQHVVIARQCDISDEEIARIAEGPDAPGWAPHEVDLLRAVDELHADAFITQPTWDRLSERWNTQELMDLVFAVGQYNLVSMALNTLGVQLEDGVEGFAETTGRG
jgi:alkylhydroperoxidase family enzyme